jgi:hypothetical protein
MADLRRATLPENLTAYVGSLSGFALQAIESACRVLERETISERQSRFPELGRVLDLCRREQQAQSSDDDTLWSLVRYRQTHYFDQWLNEQAGMGKRIEDLLAAHPDEAPAWRLWSRQLADGTLRCPQWCATCEGDRMLITTKNGRNTARSCPDCHGRALAAA